MALPILLWILVSFILGMKYRSLKERIRTQKRESVAAAEKQKSFELATGRQGQKIFKNPRRETINPL